MKTFDEASECVVRDKMGTLKGQICEGRYVVTAKPIFDGPSLVCVSIRAQNWIRHNFLLRAKHLK